MIPVRKMAVVHEVPETGETVVCDVDGGVMLVLNDTGAAVWHLVDGRRSVDDIIAFVASTAGVHEAAVRRDVVGFLGSLEEQNLVELRA